MYTRYYFHSRAYFAITCSIQDTFSSCARLAVRLLGRVCARAKVFCIKSYDVTLRSSNEISKNCALCNCVCLFALLHVTYPFAHAKRAPRITVRACTLKGDATCINCLLLTRLNTNLTDFIDKTRIFKASLHTCFELNFSFNNLVDVITLQVDQPVCFVLILPQNKNSLLKLKLRSRVYNSMLFFFSIAILQIWITLLMNFRKVLAVPTGTVAMFIKRRLFSVSMATLVTRAIRWPA